jgi:ethanolamine permease
MPDRAPNVDLRSGKLGVVQIAALGVSLVIVGQFTGWNFGLPVGGLGGMLVAGAIVLAMYLGLSRCVLELATSMSSAGGTHTYGSAAFGPLVGYLAGMSVLLALTLGVGIVAEFIAAYMRSVFGFGGWPLKMLLMVVVVAIHIRGVGEASSFTVVSSALAALVLLTFAALMLPHFKLEHLYDSDVERSLFPAGFRGVYACIPFAMWLFLAIENTALAVEEVEDPFKTLPRGLMVALATVALIGLLVLVLGTGGAGVSAIKAADDPLYAALASRSAGSNIWSARLIGVGAVSGLIASFFSLVYAASRQLFAIAREGDLPKGIAAVGVRGTPWAALLIVGVGAIIASAVPPSRLVVPIVLLLDVSYVLILAAYLRLRRERALPDRRYRAPGGEIGAWLTLALAVLILFSCLQLDAVTMECIGAFYMVAIGAFLVCTSRRAGTNRRLRKRADVGAPVDRLEVPEE